MRKNLIIFRQQYYFVYVLSINNSIFNHVFCNKVSKLPTFNNIMMINYQNRGMFLESIINKTIAYYDCHDWAIFHKKSLPIKFTGVEKNKMKLQTAWISAKSTVDYYGVYQGHFVAFEVKNTNTHRFYLKNIKEHQSNYLKKVIKHHGISFYLIGFEKINRYFIINADLVHNWLKKSFNIEDAITNGYELKIIFPGILHFLPTIELMIKKCP